MLSYNRVILMGNLTNEPETRHTASGKVCVKFGLAVDRTYTRSDGEPGKETAYVNITAWGRTGETCAEHLQKGSSAMLDGHIRTYSYEKDGERKYGWEVIADNVQFPSHDETKQEDKSPTLGSLDEDDIPF